MGEYLIIAIFIAGFVLGLGVAFLLRLVHSRTGEDLARELFQENELQRERQVGALLEELKSSFGNLSFEALSRSTAEFLKLSQERFESQRRAGTQELEGKKELIDQQLLRMKEELQKVSTLVSTLEKDREEKFGSLVQQISLTSQQAGELIRTTQQLREALASTKARGQWGERMAEDVLRVAGFQEAVNYQKQKTLQAGGRRPDFTFLLPRSLKLNMDVKFPLDNYLRFLETESPLEKRSFCDQFLKDVRKQIKEVTTRDYINPEDATVDCVLLFIPNETLFAFIHEMDASILDEALRQKVIFCSPITLFAVLAVIRRAVENFMVETTSDEMLRLLGSFKKQWTEFMRRFDQMGKRLDDARKEYDTLMTTRKRALERPLDRLEQIREERGLAVLDTDGDIEE